MLMTTSVVWCRMRHVSMPRPKRNVGCNVRCQSAGGLLHEDMPREVQAPQAQLRLFVPSTRLHA